jgi:hypothetical protein
MARNEFNLDSKGAKEHTCFLMLNCLLLTRITDGNQPGEAGTDNDTYDDEIATYVRTLQQGISKPSDIDNLKSYLFDYDLQVLTRLGASRDGAIRYMICRAANDALVVSVGIFDAPEQEDPDNPRFPHGSQGQMGRGEAYYHFAFSYTGRVVGIAETVGAAIEKISVGLDKYATILAYITGKPFELSHRLADCDVYHLVRSIEKTGKQIRLERKQDQFLDAYLEWRASRTEEARIRMMSIADELRRLDPTFTYTPGT